MNPATRLTITVGLVVALSGAIVLADAVGDYESLFGDEAKKVAASRTRTDDVKFAAKLFKAAKDMPDSPALQILLYEKTCQFGSAGAAGCDTALKALNLLEKAVPARKDHWRQRKFEIVKFRFDRSYGAARKTAGEPYMEMLEVLADAHVAEGNGTEAKKLYSRALMIATYIRSPRLADILAKSRRASALAARQIKLTALQTRLTTNPEDTAVREELILLYIVAFDKPAEAAKLLTDDLDEVTRTYVPLAAKKLDDLDEAICLELGDWYHKKLSKKASVVGRSVVLRRAHGYYQRFLEFHAKKDARSYRTKAALKSIETELKKLGVPPGQIGRTLILNLGDGVKMKLVLIPAGKFVMGSPKTETGRKDNEGPQREVTISKAFYIGVTEVTQAQYQSVTGKILKAPMNPVQKVSWHAATAFCTALSKKTGRSVRLPTEAQWEYACRAGTNTRFSFGEEDKDLAAHGWCKSNSGNKAHPVGEKKPNPAGLYDMHGNVWEWCRDSYDAKFHANAKNVDPENTAKAGLRPLRGGCFNNEDRRCRSAFRLSYPAGSLDSHFGFRVLVAPGSGGK